MSYTLEQFAADCHAALKAAPGVPGQSKVVGFVGLRGIKLARSGLKEHDTSRLQVPLEHSPAVAHENPA